MPSTIKSYTYAATTLQGVLLQNSQIFRKIKDNTWTQIRVAMRCSLIGDTGAAPLSGAKGFIGICNGNTAGFGDEIPGHCLGYSSEQSGSATTWSRGTGGTNGFNANTTAGRSGCLYVAGVLSNASGSLDNWHVTGPIDAGAALFYNLVHHVDIIRGSPYQIRHGWGQIFQYITEAQFYSQMEAVNPSFTTYATSVYRTIVVDEGANGAFDYIHIAWNRTAPALFIQDVAVVKMA